MLIDLSLPLFICWFHSTPDESRQCHVLEIGNSYASHKGEKIQQEYRPCKFTEFRVLKKSNRYLLDSRV